MGGGAGFGIGAAMIGLQGLADAPAQISSAKLAHNAQAMGRHQRNVHYKKRYHFLRRDLEASGYNPMLAITGGASPPGGGSGSVPAGSVPQGRQNVSEAFSKGARIRADAQSAKNEAERSREAITTQRAQTLALEAQAFRDERNAWLVDSQHEELQSRILSERASARYQNSLANLMDAELPSAKAAEELYEKYPWLRQAREFLGLMPARTRGPGGRGANRRGKKR